MAWRRIDAVTLATTRMARSVAFYEALGLAVTFGGPTARFSTLGPPDMPEGLHVNLFVPDGVAAGGEAREEADRAVAKAARGWGRFIMYVDDVDAMHSRAVSAGLRPEFAPRDAAWGERYFHIRDPMGHELSFANKIEGHPFWQRGRSTL